MFFFTKKKKINQFFGMNSFTLEYQAYTFRTFSTHSNIVHMKSFPKIKQTLSIRRFSSQIQSIAQFMAINRTHHMLALYILPIGSITCIL